MSAVWEVGRGRDERKGKWGETETSASGVAGWCPCFQGNKHKLQLTFVLIPHPTPAPPTTGSRPSECRQLRSQCGGFTVHPYFILEDWPAPRQAAPAGSRGVQGWPRGTGRWLQPEPGPLGRGGLTAGPPTSCPACSPPGGSRAPKSPGHAELSAAQALAPEAPALLPVWGVPAPARSRAGIPAHAVATWAPRSPARGLRPGAAAPSPLPERKKRGEGKGLE